MKEHGLENLIREKDNELRNKIAHSDFSIESERKIKVKNNVIDLNKRLAELYNFTTDIVDALNKASVTLIADLNRRTAELNKKNDELKRRLKSGAK